jgi:hypothetical protein
MVARIIAQKTIQFVEGTMAGTAQRLEKQQRGTHELAAAQ